MGMVTFSVCLLALPSSRPPPPLLSAPGSAGGRQEAHFGGKCEVRLSASWCPGTWLNIFRPNGALSRLWSGTTVLMGPAVLGRTSERAKGTMMCTLAPFVTPYFSWSCDFCAQAWSNINCIRGNRTLKCIFFGLVRALSYRTAYRDDRKWGWHAAKGSRSDCNHRAVAARTQPLYMECMRYKLSYWNSPSELIWINLNNITAV